MEDEVLRGAAQESEEGGVDGEETPETEGEAEVGEMCEEGGEVEERVGGGGGVFGGGFGDGGEKGAEGGEEG